MTTHLRPSRLSGLLAAALLIGSVPLGAQDSDSVAVRQGDGLPPAGFGRLNQDNVSVSLRAGDLEIRFTVLDEVALRLLNAEAYRSLHGLVDSKQSQIDSVVSKYGIGQPGVLLVRFFARADGTRFDAQLVSVVIRDRYYQPIGLVPLTSTLRSDRLSRRQQASGIYIFEEAFTPYLPMGFAYGSNRTDAWNDRTDALERERASIESRALEARGRRPSPN